VSEEKNAKKWDKPGKEKKKEERAPEVGEHSTRLVWPLVFAFACSSLFLVSLLCRR